MEIYTWMEKGEISVYETNKLAACAPERNEKLQH